MPDVEDCKLDSNGSSYQTSADSSKSDTNIQLPEGELDNKKDPDGAKNEAVEKKKKETLSVLRYTKEQLLALRDSPLVKKPDALPPISVWFGEQTKKEKKIGVDGAVETEKSKNSNALGSELNKSKDDSLGIPKSPLLGVSKSPNGSAPTSPKPSDKIVLGPPKWNFASSSVGGLKIVEEKTAPPRTGRSDGMRQRQVEDLSYMRTGKDTEPRAPRGPSGGRGFIGREALREHRTLTEKTTKESAGPTHGIHGRGLGNMRSHDTSRNNRREGIGGKEHSGRNTSRYQHVDDRETPEWMNYNPQTDADTNHFDNGETTRSISRADSSISWRPGNKTVTTEEANNVSNNKAAEIVQNGSKEKNPPNFDGNYLDLHYEYSSPSLNLADVDQLFGPGGMELNVKEHSGSSAFNKFLFQHELAMTEDNGPKTGTGSHIETTIPREQGTSRFARFFSHNTEEIFQDNDHMERPSTFQVSQVSPQNLPVSNDLLKPGPISLDTLFQSQVATPSTTASISPHIGPSEGIRILPGMLTEEEVLQSLGAKPPSKHEPKERNSEDEAAMFKIYAALKKGPSSSDLPIQLSHNTPISSSHQSVQFQHSAITNSGLPFNDPSIISAQKPTSINKTNHPPPKVDISNRHLGISELAPNDSVKKINMLFGGNVPTSVYRQLSSRSDNSSRESSTASSPALKFNPKPNISNFSHSPQSSAIIPDLHASVYKTSSPRSPIISQSQNPSQYHNIVPPYSNGQNNPQHSHHRQEFSLPVGRNIPVDQLFNMIPQPPRNVPQQIHPQFQQPPMTSSMPPQMPFGYQHDRYPQQLQFSGPPPIPPQHISVHHHPGLLPPGTEALFANMHGYAQFIPNLVNNAIAPHTIPGIPNNTNMQQRGMMTLEEIERRGGLGGR
ncbi:12939_t:CDS:10 [Funneliformis geosporum]|uniref:8635_t:CDS:1 n=1 Tax=Funneliformis geosporum TaxID=1117311 RepID=A0A9W4SVF0_9GLOM|nr:12939_t:CDS:10 [Funneliformis geosporum]CAI2182297.1 8635_t:CDS:10 [Funneliformis geosporum]